MKIRNAGKITGSSPVTTWESRPVVTRATGPVLTGGSRPVVARGWSLVMARRGIGAILFMAVMLLTGCGDLSQPFRGRPGRNAAWLAIPLAVRLAVPSPPQALLGETESRRLAGAVTEGLQARDVPAVALDTPLPLDWQLVITAENLGATVRPRFTLVNADGVSQGVLDGTPVPLRAWAEPTPAVLAAVATQAVPGVTQLLLSVQAARASATPGAIQAGPQRIRFLPVTGAPGDGAQVLLARMREFMSNLGFVVQEAAEGAEYGLTAVVRVEASPSPGQQLVDLQWVVTRRDGMELGRVVQVEEVGRGRLDRFWGDVAYVAAEQASGGVQTIIRNATTPGMGGTPTTPDPNPPPATPVNAAAPPRLR